MLLFPHIGCQTFFKLRHYLQAGTGRLPKKKIPPRIRERSLNAIENTGGWFWASRDVVETKAVRLDAHDVHEKTEDSGGWKGKCNASSYIPQKIKMLTRFSEYVYENK